MPTVYTHGHHASVLRSHTWRTAANSAQFLLPHLLPTHTVLDVGCGPGTITCDLGGIVSAGSVIGIDSSEKVLEQARTTATSRGLRNVTFQTGDVYTLPFEDQTFDVVHAHQLLQHLSDPVSALKEMRRVTTVGGIVAVRDADFEAFSWFPESAPLDDWRKMYISVATGNGGDPSAGKKLHFWARQAGFPKEEISASTANWCYFEREEIEWWSGLWAERLVKSDFRDSALGQGVTVEELARVSRAWTEWGGSEDAWFNVPHGEVICRKR
jgi:ubiquinone/menaquinone biosynthesis C-methylase UbiE